ncbi:MAG: Gfo/Idh/MocA family protein [Acidimicrobiales bacterium]
MRRFKLAIIGCGRVSGMHAAAYARHPERLEVVAACDPDLGRAEQLASQFAGCRYYASVADAAQGADWEVGVVCSPTPLHSQVVDELVVAGKHAFIEKPLADNLAEAQRMVGACESGGTQLAVHQNFRYHYPFDLARSLIGAGRIGRVTTVLHRELLSRQDSGWRASTERHALAVMGVHWLDGFRWMLAEEPVSVLCTLTSSPLIAARGETEVVLHARFAGGASVSYVESFSYPDPSLETNVIGEEGALRLSHAELREWHAQKAPGSDGQESGGQVAEVSQMDEVAHPNPAGSDKPVATFLALDQFLQALESGSEATNSGRDNLRTMAFLEAAYRSARLGRPVGLEPQASELVP